MFCKCGCGQETAIASRTDKRRGWVKGEPLKFIKGHSSAWRGWSFIPAVDGALGIPLTRGFVAWVDEDLDPRILRIIKSKSWFAKPSGHNMYAASSRPDGSNLLLHRLVLDLPREDGRKVKILNHMVDGGAVVDCRRANLVIGGE